MSTNQTHHLHPPHPQRRQRYPYLKTVWSRKQSLSLRNRVKSSTSSVTIMRRISHPEPYHHPHKTRRSTTFPPNVVSTLLTLVIISLTLRLKSEVTKLTIGELHGFHDNSNRMDARNFFPHQVNPYQSQTHKDRRSPNPHTQQIRVNPYQSQSYKDRQSPYTGTQQFRVNPYQFQLYHDRHSHATHQSESKKGRHTKNIYPLSHYKETTDTRHLHRVLPSPISRRRSNMSLESLLNFESGEERIKEPEFLAQSFWEPCVLDSIPRGWGRF